MANFEFKNLYLVNPCNLDDEAYARSMHAYEILDNAKIFKNFNKAIADLDFLIATSAIESKNDKRHLRNAVSIENFTENIFKVKGKIGLVFGREDYGLLNEEISQCDMLLKIPTSQNYLSLNLSHATTIILFYLYLNSKTEEKEKRIIEKTEKDKLFGFFSDLLDEINYPEHKKEKTKIMFKRMIGRAIPSKWEYHTFMGVLSKSLEKIKNK